MNGERSSLGLWRRIASTVLVMCGLTLLGYAGSEYWQMYRSQRELEVQWQGQMSARVATERPLSADDMLTRVSIPKISLDAIVVEGASRRQLSIGPGHIVETAMPGEQGNAVITGHRDTFFRHIYELNKGDEILVRRNGQVFHYRVTGKKIVQPEDVSVLKQTSDAQLTLITCYPIWYIGPAPERLVIFSKLVESGATATAAN